MEKEKIRIKLEYEQLMKDYKNMRIKLKFEMEKNDLVSLNRKKVIQLENWQIKLEKIKLLQNFY